MTEPVRVLLVDDHPVVRDGLRGQLQTAGDLFVTAEAGSGEEALAVLARHRVDVVVTDLRMPGLNGIELIAQIRAQHPGTEVLVLTTYGEPQDVIPALAAGARGYLLKDTERAALFEAIRATAKHQRVLSPAVAGHVHNQDVPGAAGAAGSVLRTHEVLSARETEVLTLVAAGRTNAQVAAALFIGEATVKTHLQRIYAKLGAADRAAAVAIGYQCGLL